MINPEDIIGAKITCFVGFKPQTNEEYLDRVYELIELIDDFAVEKFGEDIVICVKPELREE